jgi:hypothetical protein
VPTSRSAQPLDGARPIKATKGYRLGTLSDHALGTAIDIRPAQNAQIEAADWKRIQDFTGKTLDRTTRKNRWATSPQLLQGAIQEINDEFVKRLQQAVAAQVAAGQEGAAALAADVCTSLSYDVVEGRFARRDQRTSRGARADR